MPTAAPATDSAVPAAYAAVKAAYAAVKAASTAVKATCANVDAATTAMKSAAAMHLRRGRRCRQSKPCHGDHTGKARTARYNFQCFTEFQHLRSPVPASPHPRRTSNSDWNGNGLQRARFRPPRCKQGRLRCQEIALSLNRA
jgi:hypothetical protein